MLKKLAFVTILSVSSLTAGAEQCSIDWTFLSPDVPISKDPYGTKGAPVLVQTPEVINVLQTEGNPPNPFSKGNALSIAANGEKRFLRIRIRPFEGGGMTETGFVECNFRLSSGALQLSFGTITKEWNPEDDWSYIEASRLFSFRLISGEAIQARSVTSLGTQDHPVLSPETNYKFRVSWETKTDDVVFSVQLNGLPVLDNENKPFSIVIPRSSLSAEASLGMVLQSGSVDEPFTTAVIGAIEGKTGEN